MFVNRSSRWINWDTEKRIDNKEREVNQALTIFVSGIGARSLILGPYVFKVNSWIFTLVTEHKYIYPAG